jgi:hypothetical protein
MNAHLTPEQFVDLAEGQQPESAVPHLAACDACRKELADLRAMMTATTAPGVDVAPEPSPLYWHHLSSRVRDAVAQESGRSWRERVMRPFVLVPSLGAVLAAAIFAVVVANRTAEAPARLPALPLAFNTTVVPETSPSLQPLAPFGATDDPQLTLVAAVATTVEWDAMMDEVAMSTADTSDAVASALTQDEQRELQRLLTEAIAQPGAWEKLS